jgi:DNA polymerase
MCLGRQAAVFVAPPAGLRCDWLVLGEPPDDAQERVGQPFVDDAGKLLDNMLKAIGVRRCTTSEALPAASLTDVTAAASGIAPVTSSPVAYLSHVIKCRPARPATPQAAALLACAHYLRREIALLQPKVILAMGRFAMHVLLSEAHPGGLTLPLGKLRGHVWHYQGVPVVVTYPPAYLLRHGHDKASAWADLCLAQDVVQGVASTG